MVTVRVGSMRITWGIRAPARRCARLCRPFAASTAALLVLSAVLLGSMQAASAASFSAWVDGFWPTARAAGISRATYVRAFAGLTPDPQVIEAANYQPEYNRPIGEYIDRACSDKRIETGQQMLVQYKTLIDAIEDRYGVDRHIVVAIWAVESNFGSDTGDMNVIRSLATLAYDGVKESYARQQLIAALKILQRGDVPLDKMNGSWAGAMGHTQFIPTTYLSYAVDFDGDGKRDIWGDMADALASTAHYLAVSGWHSGQTWGYEVSLPNGFRLSTYSGRTYSLAQWQRLGVARVNGAPFPRPGDRADLFAPAGANGPVFLLLHNFHVILRYNQAPSYALAVGHLADRLMGYGPFSKPWPTDENHLSLDQRMELQRRLSSEGLLSGDIDGVIGPATLNAVKAYQRKKGLAVDGFPTLTILKMLRSDT
jgi:peptidoglycan lytic transglycosylase B